MSQADWATRLNYFGSAVGGAKHIVNLDPDELIEIARQTTGLSDFGDASWREPFDRLIASLEKDVDLHTVGRVTARGDLLRALRNRLLMQNAVSSKPDIRQQPITSPLMIAGHGRTGSSILFELLWQDPNNRAPIAWEAEFPVPPPPDILADGVTAKEMAQCDNEFWADFEPDIKAAHEHRWDLPVECPRFMAADFTSDYWASSFNAWDWLMWRAESRPNSAYDCHKTALQLIQHFRPHRHDKQRWLLKSPAHIGAMDLLLQRYPDMKVIQTHRDPIKTIPSTASLMNNVRRVRANNIDPNILGATVTIAYESGAKKMMRERETGVIPEQQIVDIHFQSFLKNPVETIKAAYEKLQLEFTTEYAEKIRDYLANKPRNKFGKHQYRAEDCGLTNEKIREQFRFYTDHYHIPLED